MDFNPRINVDIVPGKVTRIFITPDKIGTFAIVCHIFYGEGHDEMGGVIRVVG